MCSLKNNRDFRKSGYIQVYTPNSLTHKFRYELPFVFLDQNYGLFSVKEIHVYNSNQNSAC